MIYAQAAKEQSKILVVDDNPANVKLLKMILQINGYSDVMTLVDSREFLKTFTEYKPDLILLDLKMPYFDGFEILERFRENLQADFIPVIVITAQDDMDNRLKALQLGAQDFIGKPFNTEEVILRVNNYLNIRYFSKDIASKNDELENTLREKNRALNEMQNELIDRLLRAALFRDSETGDHISRISRYAYVLAKAMGLSEQAAEDIASAGRMHDIGKIGVPDNILTKPGRLDGPEWDNMRTHTLKGAQILSGSDLDIIRLAEQIALTHHEKWDGSGYPNGLSQTKIPLAGRIIALVDVYDALISDRPYKKSWTIEEAVDYIRQQRGVHFDPEVVDAFLQNVPLLFDAKQESACQGN